MIHSTIPFKSFKFPTGELHVQLEDWSIKAYRAVNLNFIFEKNEDIIELLLLCDALKRSELKVNQLFIPYVPFSRQDRVEKRGECFSLSVFANLINSIDADKVIITDPHSDVTPALIKNCEVIPQHQALSFIFENKSDFWLVSPDSGALKKIYKLAAKVSPYGVIECSKLRNTATGEIARTQVHAEDLEGKDCYIVDDICDGGRTFIEIAKILKTKNCGRIILAVTHGFFTKGLEVFEGFIDEIYTLKGKIK